MSSLIYYPFDQNLINLFASNVLLEIEKSLKEGTIKPEQLGETSSTISWFFKNSVADSSSELSINQEKILSNRKIDNLEAPKNIEENDYENIQKKYGIFGRETAKKIVEALKARSLLVAYSNQRKEFTVLDSSKISREFIKKILAEKDYHGWQPKVQDNTDGEGNKIIKLAMDEGGADEIEFASEIYQIASIKLNGDEIAEVLQAQVGFTIATDKKPVLATWGCSPCVALAGYDASNKIAFLVHFSSAHEVRKSGELIFANIIKLAKEKIESPIQLHLRGGIKGLSEAIIGAIKIWMEKSKVFTMEIASQEILLSGKGRGKSLAIDSRTGAVSEYNPMMNPKSKGISDLDGLVARMSAFDPKISLAYTPK